MITESPQFFTATILEWKRLLKPDKYKDIIISSLEFLVNNKTVEVNAFVIMDNHIHLIWQMMEGNMANDGGHKTRGGSKGFYEIYGTKNKAGFNKESSCCIVAF